MAVKDVSTTLATTTAEDPPEPMAELIETPDGGLEAEIPEPGQSWKEKKQQRYEDIARERDEARAEAERLRSEVRQPAHYQPPAVPQPGPHDEEWGRLVNRQKELREEQQNLWELGQKTDSKDTLARLTARADKITEEMELISARKGMLVYGVGQAPQQTTPQQVILEGLRADFQDVYKDARGQRKARAIYESMVADGEQESPALIKKSLERARAWVRSGYKDAPQVSAQTKARMAGERSGGHSHEQGNRVSVTPEVTKWAKALHPNLPERDAVGKFVAQQGEALKKAQARKAG